MSWDDYVRWSEGQAEYAMWDEYVKRMTGDGHGKGCAVFIAQECDCDRPYQGDMGDETEH